MPRFISTPDPNKSNTPFNAIRFGNTFCAAFEFLSNAVFNVFIADNNPLSLICCFNPSDDNPIETNAFSACGVVFNNPERMPFNCVAPAAAFVPVLLIAANAAPTSWNCTPIFDATGNTAPIAPAKSLASNLPSRTEAVKTSVACDASSVSDP